MTFPEGHLPYGYHYLQGYPVERDTESGMEASIVYVGPPDDRWLFLEEIFGRWELTESVIPQEADYSGYDLNVCATLVKPPMRYRMRSGREEDDEQIFYDHLWPDTFTIQPLGNPAPYINEHEDEEGFEILERSLSYDCLSQITVNYRSKCHADWPTWMYKGWRQMGDHPRDIEGDQTAETAAQGCFALPVIEDGTFISASQRESVEVQTIPGRFLEFDTSEGGWPSGEDPQITEDISVPVAITTTELEVEWSNVPIIPQDALAFCRGRVNNKPFLGYPKNSVLFTGAEINSKRPFYHRWNTDLFYQSVEVSSIRYHFVIKTVRSHYGGHTYDQCFDEMGYYNRRWCMHGIPDAGAPPAWSAAYSYPAGFWVTYNDEVYSSVINVPAGQVPTPSLGYWRLEGSDTKSYFRKVQSRAFGQAPLNHANLGYLFQLDVCS